MPKACAKPIDNYRLGGGITARLSHSSFVHPAKPVDKLVTFTLPGGQLLSTYHPVLLSLIHLNNRLIGKLIPTIPRAYKYGNNLNLYINILGRTGQTI